MPLPPKADDPVGHYAYKLGEAEQEVKQLRAALHDIAHGNWSSPTVDSEAANVYAQIVAEMQSRASAALANN